MNELSTEFRYILINRQKKLMQIETVERKKNYYNIYNFISQCLNTFYCLITRSGKSFHVRFTIFFSLLISCQSRINKYVLMYTFPFHIQCLYLSSWMFVIILNEFTPRVGVYLDCIWHGMVSIIFVRIRCIYTFPWFVIGFRYTKLHTHISTQRVVPSDTLILFFFLQPSGISNWIGKIF